MDIQILESLEDIEKVWRSIVVPESIFDVWEYRLSFNLGYQRSARAVVMYENNQPIGFLPLEYEAEEERYLFFGGGDWNEQFRFYTTEAGLHTNIHSGLEAGTQYSRLEIINILLKHSPKPVSLFFIDKREEHPLYEDDEETYYLISKNYSYSIENLFAEMSPKGRKNIKNDIKKVQQLNPEIIFGNVDDLQIMSHFNVKRFGHDSTFNEEGFARSIHAICANQFLRSHILPISIYINHEVEAVALCMMFQKELTYIMSGTNPAVPNLNKLLNYTVIDYGMRHKFELINLLTSDTGWKDHWRIPKKMLYALRLK